MQAPGSNPPPRSRLRRTGTILGYLVAALIIFGVMAIGPLLLFGRKLPFYFDAFGDNVYAPGLWSTVRGSQPPDDQVYAGTWLPAGSGLHTTFPDGTPYTFGADSSLTLRPDHTFSLSRLGKYDGNSHLLCLRSEQGQWQIQADSSGRVAVDLIAGDGPPPPTIERSVIKPRSEEEWSAAFNAEHSDAESHDLAVARDDDQACDPALPLAGYFVFYLARRGSAYALYQPAGESNWSTTAKSVLLVKQTTR